MYWFCGINDNDLKYRKMYINALKSARKNTTLNPIILYDGNDDIFINEIEKYNGTVIKHTTLLNNKPNFKNKDIGFKGIATGAYLRVDIPIICARLNIKDETVLYTDVDVIFVKDVVSELQTYKPNYFAICPQTNKTDYVIFNSGVMLINVKAMFDTYIEFTDFVEVNNYNFTACVQGALQEFYKGKSEELPLYFNHKPYWGVDSNAKIVHYHGPKYNDIVAFFNGNIHPAYGDIFVMVSNDVWTYFLNLYEVYDQNFDWQFYLDKNPDLRPNGIHTEEQAVTHWISHGRNEGRSICVLDELFNWRYYLHKYPDLRENGVNNEHQAVNHWLSCGKKEGRTARTNLFNWNFYLNSYPDLSANGINSEEKALKHWLIHGKREGRTACINRTLTHTVNDILYCQPIFAPDLIRLNKNMDSLESFYNYLKHNNLNINCTFGGWCINDEYWNIISAKIVELFKINPVRFDKNYGKAYVVNSLLETAQLKFNFKYILTADSDIMFDINEPNIFERLITCVGLSECTRLLPVGVIGLNQTINNLHDPIIYENSIELNTKYGKEKLVYPIGHGGIAGSCIFITLEGWRKTGGYRLMGVYAGDDAYLLMDLINNGFSIQMAHTINCIHPLEKDVNYNNWKYLVCQRDQVVLSNIGLKDKIEEADEFWSNKV